MNSLHVERIGLNILQKLLEMDRQHARRHCKDQKQLSSTHTTDENQQIEDTSTAA